MTVTPDEILAKIPGWEKAVVSELDGGLSNRTYRVNAGAKVAVLKIDDGPRKAPLNTRYEEAAVQTRAAQAGLAAPVIHVDSHFYLTEYVAGTVWRREFLGELSNLELLATALRRLHALPRSGRLFDPSVAARQYGKASTVLSADVIHRCEAVISSMEPPRTRCCCHNDLVAENLITTPELMFLDWEYACDNDPLFDLATVSEHHELNEEQVCRLLHTYFDGNGEPWRMQLEKQRLLYLALLCLWSASRSVVDHVTLRDVVERLITRSS